MFMRKKRENRRKKFVVHTAKIHLTLGARVVLRELRTILETLRVPSMASQPVCEKK